MVDGSIYRELVDSALGGDNAQVRNSEPFSQSLDFNGIRFTDKCAGLHLASANEYSRLTAMDENPNNAHPDPKFVQDVLALR